MKKQIVEILKNHPGLRKREVAQYLRIPHFDVIAPMYELCAEGILRYEVYKNLPNIEYYEKYYVVEGKKND